MQIKIAIIGAGSATFSAGLVRDLCVHRGLHGSHVTLMDVDAKRLAMVSRLAERLSDELDAGLSFSQTLDRQEALQGAGFVINTAQVGGHSWMEAQRSLEQAEALLAEWFGDPRNEILARAFGTR